MPSHLSSSGSGGGGSYTLPAASPSVLGGVKVGSGLAVDGSGVLSAGGPAIKLDWSATTDLASETVLTAATWQDLCPNVSFVVSAAGTSAVLAISVRGQAQAGENSSTGAIASRFVLDSAGSAQAHNLGAGWKVGGVNAYVNVFDGANTVYVMGLAAGSHTIKVQVFPNVAGVALYCRAASFPDTESLSIQVVEL